jgi:hypothetical protein
MTSPYISSRLAEQRIQELLRQADQGRLRRVAREQPRAQRPARRRPCLLLSLVPGRRRAFA